ncbi:unnamed protein product [Heligmosomoides polygyrus]|uniref:Reverse transcriptase n=1 Tax=Heligmosomoides polygyrus TaxID=6339 RepID=A0A183GDK7_HELPZ|nr:unnamed protein product [Heligmosomoides polygyrus]
METKILRWTAGVTRLGRVRNDSIRQRFGVTPIFEKMREALLRWYGYVLCGKDDTVRKTGLSLDVCRHVHSSSSNGQPQAKIDIFDKY